MKKERDFYQVSLKLILKNEEGKILALGTPENSTFKGYYDLPGGRIDTDEFETPFPEIIKREAEEEIGPVKFTLAPHPVGLGRCLLPSQNHKILYVMFEGKYKSGEVKISDEHTSYKWLKVTPKNANQYFIYGILEGIKMYLDN